MLLESSKLWAIRETLWNPFETVAPEKAPLLKLFMFTSKGAFI